MVFAPPRRAPEEGFFSWRESYGDKAMIEKYGWSTRVVLKYLLFQIPGWILLILILLMADHWLDLRKLTMLSIVILWISKDLIMFPFVWRAYDQNSQRIVYRMIGERAVVKERLSPSGYVQVHGELWRAELMPDTTAVEKGRMVRVREVRGLTLIVQPETLVVPRMEGNAPKGAYP